MKVNMPVENGQFNIVENGQFNIGHICTGLQCQRGLANRIAYHWLDRRGNTQTRSFAELNDESSQFANLLNALDFKAGEIFFIYLAKVPQVFGAFLGALKLRLIVGTLFSSFGDAALLDRLADSQARGIITSKKGYRKICRIKDQLPALKTIILIDGNSRDLYPEGVYCLPDLLAASSKEFNTPLTSADTPSVLLYTSGSTGRPKGVLHQHRSVLQLQKTGLEVLGLGSNDIFWCTADHGWITGISYGIIAPWCLGITQVHYNGPYDAAAWLEIIERQKITCWYTAPTALRMLMREEQHLFQRYSFAELRRVFSVGEPLNPEVIEWGQRIFAQNIYDTWFQTETGAIMIANHPGIPIKPGSMGLPVAGIEAGIINEDGAEEAPDESGNLGVRSGWESMFVDYLHNSEARESKFRNGWYDSGDIASCDSDGYFWFKGRGDDIINTSGHLIGPFEVESALIEHPEVAESAVVGVPDQLLGEKVVAYITLAKDAVWNEKLELRTRIHLSNRVSSLATPQEFIVLEKIPKNRSGKILRRVLKAWYGGENPGDISTLDDANDKDEGV